MTRRFVLPLYAFILTGLDLLAQVDPEPVNSPQRQVTEGASEGGLGFLWIGVVLVVLVAVLLILRGKSSTRNRPHRTNN